MNESIPFMRDNQAFEKDEALNKLLHAWKLGARLPPRFQEAVWQRIARRQTEAMLNPWTFLSDWLARVFARPRMALSYVASLLLLGLIGGYWHVRLHKDRVAEEMSVRYVQAVDPYQNLRR